ncbi:MAG: universal stress protein [Saprospiraceae bacterium]
MDRSLIRYATHLQTIIPWVQEVIFLHNIKFEYPLEAEEVTERLDRSLDEVVREDLEEKISQLYTRALTIKALDIEVTTGKSTPNLLADYCRDNEIDLVVCGKKRNYRGSGSTMERLLRIPRFKASMLMVPETPPGPIHHILVPVDFSSHSKEALRLALHIEKETGGDVECQHIFDIPTHYFPYIPVGKVRESMQKDAMKDWEKFRKNLGDEISATPDCTFSFTKNRSTAETVYELALSKGINLIIIGSRGRGGIPATLFGSVALQLFKFDFHIPLLIVR